MTKEINFLLLGESGAGKSTTINALANYFKSGEFDEVNKTADSLIEVIPSHFTLPDPENELKMLEIASNLSSPYERQEHGRSTTSKPTGYCFFFGNDDHVLRIIDTPGIGDTDGVEADKRNLEQTFLFLQTIELLHGIIFIVKGNESRHSLQFKFCIIELLTHLHKNAVANLIFCFTYSQIDNEGIGIGNGFNTISSFLNEEHIKSVGIKLEPAINAFFIDNNVYRYLLAEKQGYPWTQKQTEYYRYSWNFSAKELHQLLKHLLTMPPLNLAATVSLNSARNLIVELSTPIFQLTQKIENLNQEVNNTKTEIDIAVSKKIFLESILYITVNEVKKTPVLTKKLNGCEFHTPGSETLQFLNEEEDSFWNFFVLGYNRNKKRRQKEIAKLKCTCTENVTYNEETTSKEVLNENFVQQLNDLKNEIEEKNALLVEHQNTAKELKTEKAMIKEIGSKLAHYINSNSTFIYNNYFETYIDRIIKEINQKKSFNTIEHNSLKTNYQAKAARLTESVAANSCQNAANEDVTAEKVLEMQRKLLELKYSGQHFHQVLEKSQTAQAMFERTEKNVFIIRKITNDFTKLIFKTFFGEEWYSKQHQQSDFMDDQELNQTRFAHYLPRNESNSSFQNENLTLL